MKESLKIGEVAKILGVSIITLRNWEKTGKLLPFKTSGGHRFYKKEDIEKFMLDLEALGLAWAGSQQVPEISADYYCERQDRFTNRLDKMSISLLASLGENSRDLVSLVILVVGEIGDNSFAHNIGSWPDVPGIFFAYDIGKRIIVLADRGRGVRATLVKVRPDIKNDLEALSVAFTEIISGRSPEKRGNGLKVVRSVAESGPIGLHFQSGLGMVDIPPGSGKMKLSTSDRNFRGTYAIIKF